MKNASSEIQRDEITRIQKVRNAAAEACVGGCDGSWLECAIEVFSLNGMEVAGFASYIFELLAQGRGKFRNIMIYGQTNCAKTFMVKPLKCIFGDRLFDNPANEKYAWVGADKAEVILLQDFRFRREVITWNDLLLLVTFFVIRGGGEVVTKSQRSFLVFMNHERDNLILLTLLTTAD